jgi:SAM-dependent methyltransferase
VPSCRECYKFDPLNQVCSVPEGSPIRKCALAFLEQSIGSLEPGTSVVEIGCGRKSYIQAQVSARGCTWYGVDPKPPGDTIATHRGRVDSIPLPVASVDYVFASQSLEHWHEFGTRFQTGMLEVFRVLKPGGKFFLDVAFLVHGHMLFVRGQVDRVLTFWDPRLWTDLEIDEWRKDHDPLPRYPRWRRYGFPDEIIPNPETASTWMLSVVATRRGDVPPTTLAWLRLREGVLGGTTRIVFLIVRGLDIARWWAIGWLSANLPEPVKRPLKQVRRWLGGPG